MQTWIKVLMSAALASGARTSVLLAQAQSVESGRLAAALAATQHVIETDLGHPLSSMPPGAWRFSVSSPDSADWKIAFARLRTRLHARAPLATDRWIDYLEINETRLSDTASMYRLTVGVTSRCQHDPGRWIGSETSTTVAVTRSGTDWSWREDGFPLFADPGFCQQ